MRVRLLSPLPSVLPSACVRCRRAELEAQILANKEAKQREKQVQLQEDRHYGQALGGGWHQPAAAPLGPPQDLHQVGHPCSGPPGGSSISGTWGAS